MKLIPMSDYNRAAKTYWCVMVVAGATVFAWALNQSANLTPLQWAEFAGLVSLVILASSNPIRIPNTNSSFTAGDTFTFLAVLFLGVPSAILIGCVDSFVSSRRTSRRMDIGRGVEETPRSLWTFAEPRRAGRKKRSLSHSADRVRHGWPDLGECRRRLCEAALCHKKVWQ